MLQQLQAGDDDGEPLQLYGNDATQRRDVPLPPTNAEVIVDGAPVSAVMQQDGPASVCCVITHDVTVIVSARHLALDHVVLKRISDRD